MKLIIRKEAEHEISRRQHGPGTHFTTNLEQAFQRIQESPERYPAVYRGIRKANSRTFPYNVCYLSSEPGILALRVLHQRRREPTW